MKVKASPAQHIHTGTPTLNDQCTPTHLKYDTIREQGRSGGFNRSREISTMSKKEQSLTNTVEMTSVYGSLESNTDMDLTEDESEKSEDGSEDQDSQTKSSFKESSSDEDPPSQVQSPISVKVLVKEVKAVSTEKCQEVSSDNGSQDVEEGSGRVKSPINVKVQTTTTNGSQEVSPDRINRNLEKEQSLTNTVEMTSVYGSLESNTDMDLTEDGSEDQDSQKKSSSKDLISDVNSETEKCVTLSRESSHEKCSRLKRKSGSAEEEVGKEKKFK